MTCGKKFNWGNTSKSLWGKVHMCVLSEIACTATVSEEGGCGWLKHRKEVPVLWSGGPPRIRTAALVQMGPPEECT